ncbi:MAG: ATPase, T2SS/T4P/T4SS family [Planctomycetaceae bacterium]
MISEHSKSADQGKTDFRTDEQTGFGCDQRNNHKDEDTVAGRYYIRNRGKTLGPLTVDKLQAMAKRGRFGRHFEVSTDGRRWAHADEFPELFPEGGGGGGGGGGDDGFDDDPVDDGGAIDPYAPLVDDAPAAGRRRRPSEGSASRRASRRTASESDGGERRRERPGRERPGRESAAERPGRRRPAEDDAPPPRKRPVEADEAAPARPMKKKKRPNVFEEAEGRPPEKKKRGGLLGFLFGSGGGDSDYKDQPHLRKLTHIHRTMKDLGFSLDKLILVGSGGEKISVAEHDGSGDGPHLLGLLTLIGFQSRTSDMHFEPTPDGVDIRMRIDGTLTHLVRIPHENVKRLYGIIKVLCQTKMGASQEVLEGSYSTVAPGRRSDYRVSFTPSVHGQKLAIRVLDADSAPKKLNQLGAPARYVATINAVMQQNAGMVLMCGPTGSGKTTTLYSMLRSVDFKTRNVMTLEDPVEYQIDGITQINIDAEHGKGFGEMLPALLRQDPDVLLIGEIRDGISAKIAMQATMTGHLVLSTLHAQDTLATVHRLLDLNADPNMVASALDLVMSQRLLRTLCDDCKRRRRPDDQDKRRLGGALRDAIYDPQGCTKCLGTGYIGRRAIFELLDVKKQIGDAIHSKHTIPELRAVVRGTEFASLRQNGYSLVAQGVTTFDEVDRVIGVE